MWADLYVLTLPWCRVPQQLLALCEEGVRDFSISRAAVSWGIPIPNDPQQTVYVWFDALIGTLCGCVPVRVCVYTRERG